MHAVLIQSFAGQPLHRQVMLHTNSCSTLVHAQGQLHAVQKWSVPLLPSSSLSLQCLCLAGKQRLTTPNSAHAFLLRLCCDADADAIDNIAILIEQCLKKALCTSEVAHDCHPLCLLAFTCETIKLRHVHMPGAAWLKDKNTRSPMEALRTTHQSFKCAHFCPTASCNCTVIVSYLQSIGHLCD